MGKRIYRDSHTPSVINLRISQETRAALEAVAEADECSMANVAREALEKGLPAIRESRRKKRARLRAKEAVE